MVISASNMKPGYLGTSNDTTLSHFQVIEGGVFTSKSRWNMKFRKMVPFVIQIADALNLNSEWEIHLYKHSTWPKLSKEFKSGV